MKSLHYDGCFCSPTCNIPGPFHKIRAGIKDIDYAALFTELQKLFKDLEEPLGTNRVNEIIINLYLVIARGRTAYLFDVHSEYNNVIMNILNTLARQYDLDMVINYPNVYISKEKIIKERLDDPLYRAQILDYGCLDLNYWDVHQKRIQYQFTAYKNEDPYPIMIFMCTVPKAVSEGKNMEIAKKFEDALHLMGADWGVEVCSRSYPAWKDLYPNW